jgi:hypothetical protein
LSADANPSRLFDGVKFRLSIFICSNQNSGWFSTKYTRWFSDERNILFSGLINYNDRSNYFFDNISPKISSPLFVSIAEKVLSNRTCFFANTGNHFCLYNDAPVNWMRSHVFIPYFRSERDGEIISRHLKKMHFDSREMCECGSAVMNSTLFFLWWISHSSCYNLNTPEFTSFRLDIDAKLMNELSRINKRLTKDVRTHSRRRVYVYKTTGRVEYDEFYMKLSKPIIDEIDAVLAEHYGFTAEELDYIVNYDIKYRMGDELEGN